MTRRWNALRAARVACVAALATTISCGDSAVPEARDGAASHSDGGHAADGAATTDDGGADDASADDGAMGGGDASTAATDDAAGAADGATSSDDAAAATDASLPADAQGAAPDSSSPPPDAAKAPPGDAAAPPHDLASACHTRITYGGAWVHGANHPGSVDDAPGEVTWDGTCPDAGADGMATLSNGWTQHFRGHGRCELSFDYEGCPKAPTACETRLTYGAAWIHPPNHPAQSDDVAGFVAWDGVCYGVPQGQSEGWLSNGWKPHFTGAGSCGVSARHVACGERYVNPVVGESCPDPGVLRDGADYYAVCTSGGAAAAFPIRRSRDLVHWEPVGHVFPAGKRPAWASGDFWAPEIHLVGGKFIAYFTARKSGGKLAIGAASASSPTGPYTDIGAPLVYDPQMGLIDATEHTAAGKPYLYWKEDGNAVGKKTPIHVQPLAADGLSLTGARGTVITNDRPWEGGVVEAPWVSEHGGKYYLFYSGNSYANGTYAVGVASSSSPTGPFTKASQPILVTNAAFVGPGHCSVIDTAAGQTWMVYHAWRPGHVNTPGDGRQLLIDEVAWGGGGPSLPGAPTSSPRAAPKP